MKKIFLFVLVAALFSACQQQEKRYTQQSPEIDTYRKVIESYEKRDWETLASQYADSAQIMNNVTKKNARTITELIATNKEDATLFSSWHFVDEESEYEMVVDDKGKTWVNFWGVWQGDLASKGMKYEIPVHLTANFVDGKIVQENGYWDNSKVILDLQQMKMAETSMETEAVDASTNEEATSN